MPSILFGICRFVAYSLLDWFSVDLFVTFLTIGSCCVCLFMSLFLKSDVHESMFLFLGGSFLLLFLFVGLSFPSSSMIIRNYFSGKGMFIQFGCCIERNFVWSLLSISSCIGSIIAGTLCYFVKEPSKVFSYVTRFGISCVILFYVFFPTKKIYSEEKKDSDTKSSSLSKKQEYICLVLCFIAYFLVCFLVSSYVDLFVSSHHQ